MKQTNTKLLCCCLVLFTALLLALPARAQTIDPDLQAVLDALGPLDRAPVIVRFAGRTDLGPLQPEAREARRSRIVGQLRARTDASLGTVEHQLRGPSVTRRAELWLINALALTASAEVIRALAEHPGVARISLDAVIEGADVATGQSALAEWNLDTIRAPELWAAGYTGSGVVVGSIGTRSIELIADVAPSARWIAVDVFDAAGAARTSAILEGIQRLLDPDGDPDTDEGADVIFLPGSPDDIAGPDREFDQDLDVLRAAQVAVVFADSGWGSREAPLIAGAVALLRGAHPVATVAQLERALESSAVDLGAVGPDPVYGHGRIDLVIAEELLERVTAKVTAPTIYTEEAEFLGALSGLETVAEGFEDDAAWGAARSPDTLSSVTSQGIGWTSNHPDNEVSTSNGAAHTGGWGVFSSPHGDQAVPNPTDFIEDGVVGTSDQPLAAVGAWIRGFSGSEVSLVLDGDESNAISLGPLDTAHRFHGVVVDGGFSSFEFRETEGTLEDQKYVFFDDVTVALAGGGVVPAMDGVVAGVANQSGALGSDWHSDLSLHNAAALQATVELYFSTGDGPQGAPATVAVAPDQTVTLDDVVASEFGETGSGAIFWRVVEGDPDALVVSANTYNRRGAVRRYGQQIHGVRWGDAAPVGSRVLQPALAGRYRTNLGFATDGDCSAVVVRGYDRTSRLAAQQTLGVEPWSWVQLNSLFRRVFPDLIDDPDTVALAESIHRFEVVGFDGRVISYTSIVDNATSDGSYMLGQVAGANDAQWLPGAAVVLGANDSDWRSDVVLVSTAGAPSSADIAFFPADQDNSGPPVRWNVPLGISESLFIGNILAELFGYEPPAVGSLAISSPDSQPLLWMRTYTEQGVAGGDLVTYGQAILPRTGANTVMPGMEGRIAGFSHDAANRANLILQNTRAAADGTRLTSEVLVEQLAADGSVLHEQTYALLPGEYRQHNRFVSDFGVAPVQGATLRVTVLDEPSPGDTGGVDAMVSEVNGNILDGTNDGRLLRAEVVTPP